MNVRRAWHRVGPVPLLLSVLLGTTACDEGTDPQVMVFVQAETGVRARTEHLEVRIEGGPAAGSRELKETLVYTDSSSDEGFDLAWPLRIALEPESGDVSRTFQVTATATDADGLVAQTSVVGGYLPREALALHVWLRDACLDVPCTGQGETCRDGTCKPVPTVDPCTLETLDGTLPDECSPVDAGTSDAGTDAGIDPTSTHNVAFITSTQQAPGSLGGLDGADMLCRTRAEAAGLPRPESYVAWLSDDTIAAKDRLIGSRGWVRTDGRPIADTIDDLTSGILYYPPALDENGVRPTASQAWVATGSNNDGTRQLTAYRCGEWTDDDPALDVWHGNALDATGRWSTTGNLSDCGTPLAILCFGTGQTEPLDPPELPDATTSLAFVSKSALPGADTDIPDGGVAMGIERFDQLCESEADDAGLAGTYAALLGTTTEAAVDRLPSAAAPWARPDGVVVAESKLDIANERLLAPVTVTADRVQYVDRMIWAGANSPGITEGNNANCADWTDGSYGRRGIGGSTFATFVDGSFEVCGSQYHVLCFQTGN